MADKCAGVDIYCGHRFRLINDQVAARFQLNFTLQRPLDLIFHIKEIENRLASGVMLQLAGHLGNVLRGKLQQCFIG